MHLMLWLYFIATKDSSKENLIAVCVNLWASVCSPYRSRPSLETTTGKFTNLAYWLRRECFHRGNHDMQTWQYAVTCHAVFRVWQSPGSTQADSWAVGREDSQLVDWAQVHVEVCTTMLKYIIVHAEAMFVFPYWTLICAQQLSLCAHCISYTCVFAENWHCFKLLFREVAYTYTFVR